MMKTKLGGDQKDRLGDEKSFRTATMEFLISMSEYELQQKIIEPLLRILEFTHVRDVSGPVERGKDLIAVKHEFGKAKLYAIQIKKFKFSGKVASSNSVIYVLNQLSQMMMEPAIDPTNNVDRIPDRGIFITPYPIHRDAFMSSMGMIRELERREITLIDGPLLADQLLLHMPEAAFQGNVELQYRLQIAQAADQVLESSAFGLRDPLSVDQIYIDIGVGYTREHLSEIPSSRIQQMPTIVTTFSPSDLNELRKCWEQWDIKGPGIWIPPRSGPKKTPEKRPEMSRTKKRHKKRITQELLWQRDEPYRPQADLVEVDVRPLLKAIKSEIGVSQRNLFSAIEGNIDEQDLNRAISKGISINQRLCSLEAIELVRRNWPIFDHSNVPTSSRGRAVRLPVEALHMITSPVLLTGQPGAGKTTLLRRLCQMTARQSSRFLPILLSLVKVRNPTKDAFLEDCMHQLANLGYPTNYSEFNAGLQAGRYRLLFDGLDEAGSHAIELLGTITDLASEYPKCSIIVSCRDSFTHLEWPSAVQLHLSYFDSSQLELFIEKWFAAQPTARVGIMMWLNDNPSMHDVLRVPMNAALLCSLYESNSDLPTSENELYEERFALLLGKWERAKGIRPLSLEIRRGYWHFLMSLAYDMHRQEIRTVYHPFVVKTAEQYFSKSFHRSPSEMVLDVIQRGILLRTEGGELSFGHLTYQEFLAGRWLFFQNPIGFICSKISSHWWTKALEYYAVKIGDISPLIVEFLNNDQWKGNRNAVDRLYQLSKLAPLTARKDILELKDLLEKYIQRSRRKKQGFSLTY